ncbi:N-acetylmuramic acid 6-phosphate etherase [Veronia pacifica]|nr:N-acetylmuramic acid 6-phosphate etherase [Veronia pacifica]
MAMITESRNPATKYIDKLDTLDLVKVINSEDKKVASAVELVLPEIARAIEVTTAAFKRGGRLIYIGAGTSGRLGILDASECPPTFGTDPDMVVGLIAGGEQAIRNPVENAEDNRKAAISDLLAIRLAPADILVGVAASGRTPYVLSAVEFAKDQGVKTIGISSNPGSELELSADIAITPVVGPEVISGSSRLKSGTAQKMILNMLTTGAMVKMGKVFGNLMVDVQASNAKLVDRQKKIIMEVTGCTYESAEKALVDSQGHCKTAILMVMADLTYEEATLLLDDHQGFISAAFLDRGIPL